MLAAVIAVLSTGCGSSIDNTESSKAEQSSSAVDSQSSGADSTSSESESSSAAETTTTTADSSSESTSDSSSQSDTTTTEQTTETTTKQSDTSESEKQTTASQGQTTTTTTSAGNTTTTAAKTTTAATTKAASGTSDNGAIPKSGQWYGNVFVCDRYTPNIRGLIGFGGYDGAARTFCSMVNDMKKMVGSSVNVYTMGAPVSSAFYTPKGVSNVTSDQHKAITDLNKYLVNVKNVDAYAALAPHVNEYIYYRSDHHWTELAAYYACEAFAKAAGVPYKPLSAYEAKVKKNFVGSMLGYSGCQEFKTYPDTYYYWKPKNAYTTTYYNGYFQNGQKSSLFLEWASGSGCYCTVLGSDMNLAEIKTDVKNGRTLVLIKDSYGNALVPYFVGSFEKIYVLDMRYTNIKLSSFFKQIGATDILFGSSLSSFYTPDRVSRIRKIM